MFGGRMASANGNSDGELIARVASKDRVAIEVLYGRYQVRLFRFLVRLVRNEAVAEELTNETFLEIWRTAERFESRSSPSTWMFAIARNKALSLLRKRSEAELDDDAAMLIEDDSDTPEVAAQKGDKAALIRACLARLSTNHREVVELVYYHDKSIKEVSDIVGIPENTVKTRMFHARKKLSELMAEAGVDRGWP
jgi:RNA polymerase sigma-70 factor (ECF subfamily)